MHEKQNEVFAVYVRWSAARHIVINVILFILVAKGVVGYSGAETGCGGASGRLKLSRPLPLGAAGEPKHEPIVWIILLGEVSGEEEG